jgi:hypothetical protein
MLSFSEFMNSEYVFTEELHPEITSALDSGTSSNHKLNHITKTIRGLIKNGHDTGLEDSKPKKGSSRAVFFPKDKHKLNLDGHDTEMHHVVKVAFPGTLDKHNHSGKLLGEHQNAVESDHFTNHHYGIIRKKDHGSGYETNHEGGVLAPMLGSHEDDHHVHFGKVHPLKGSDFKDLTKTPSHPKGISHKEFHEAMMLHHDDAHGTARHVSSVDRKRIEHNQTHPLVEKMNDFAQTTGNHPGDMRPANMGIWHHPVTGSKHIVMSDYGFSHDVAKHYQDARKNQMKANRGW